MAFRAYDLNESTAEDAVLLPPFPTDDVDNAARASRWPPKNWRPDPKHDQPSPRKKQGVVKTREQSPVRTPLGICAEKGDINQVGRKCDT
eukprot:6095534-Pyramimonas_sp.AAC.1